MQAPSGGRVQGVEHVVRSVDTDLVEQRERPDRVAAAEAHGCIDVVATGVAGFVHGDRVVEVSEKQTIGDVPGLGTHHRGLPTDVGQEGLQGLHGVGVGELGRTSSAWVRLGSCGSDRPRTRLGRPLLRARSVTDNAVAVVTRTASVPPGRRPGEHRVLDSARLRQAFDHDGRGLDAFERVADVDAGPVGCSLRSGLVLLHADHRPARVTSKPRNLCSDRTHPEGLPPFSQPCPQVWQSGPRRQ